MNGFLRLMRQGYIKTEKDLAALSKHLLKLTVERAMNAELAEHLGYEKHAFEGKNSGNNRNGNSSKILKVNFGEVEISTPRDRNSTFEPQIIKGSVAKTARISYSSLQ